MKLFEPVRVIVQSGDPYKNPIVIALARRRKRHLDLRVGGTVREALKSGLIMAIVSAIFVWGLLGYLSAGFVCAHCGAPAGWLALLIVPLILSIDAAMVTTSFTQHEDYHLTQLTALSTVERAWGFLFAALHRWCSLLTLSVGLLPGALMGITFLSLLFIDPDMFGGLAPDALSLFWTRAVAAIGLAVALAGMHFLGTIAGVASGLWRKRATEAGLVAFGFTFSTIVLLALGIYKFASLEWFALAAVVAVMPYVLALGAFHLAVRWA